MIYIKIKYRDKYTPEGKWSYTDGEFRNLQEAGEWWGLNEPDIDYEILELKQITY